MAELCTPSSSSLLLLLLRLLLSPACWTPRAGQTLEKKKKPRQGGKSQGEGGSQDGVHPLAAGRGGALAGGPGAPAQAHAGQAGLPPQAAPGARPGPRPGQLLASPCCSSARGQLAACFVPLLGGASPAPRRTAWPGACQTLLLLPPALLRQQTPEQMSPNSLCVSRTTAKHSTNGQQPTTSFPSRPHK